MIKNAKIKHTTVGPEDHGIFTAMLHLEFDGGCGQGFGGYDLRRAKTAYIFIAQVLKIAGVRCWEELPGQYIRFEEPDLGGPICRIAHIVEDVWFDARKLEELAK